MFQNRQPFLQEERMERISDKAAERLEGPFYLLIIFMLIITFLW
jgi:hypothetical protein